MNTTTPPPPIDRILFAALIGGPWVAFGAFALVRATGEAPSFDSGVEGLPLLATIALFLSVGGAIASRVMTAVLLKQASAQTPRPQPEHVMRQTQLIGQALCEGGGLFGAVAWFLEGSPAAIVALVVATVAAFRFWPGEQRRRQFERALDPMAGPGI